MAYIMIMMMILLLLLIPVKRCRDAASSQFSFKTCDPTGDNSGYPL